MSKIENKTLNITHPHLLKEWDYDKNEIKPEEVTHGSRREVWWKCSKCGYSWKTPLGRRTVKKRNIGCPACAGVVTTDKNSLLINYPEIAAEWDYENNKGIDLKSISFGSNKRVSWVCSKNNEHRWEVSIGNRVRKNSGCPFCDGQRATKSNNLKIKFPQIAKEWDVNKNKGRSPEEVCPESNTKVWWLCSVCGYSWRTIIQSRTRKIKPSGCPACAHQVPTIDNNLEKLYPHLMEEWDYSKNKVLPQNILPGTNRKVCWICKKCGYSWEAVVKNRTRSKNPAGCPICSRALISKPSKVWLDELNVPVREYHIKSGRGRGFRVDGFNPETNTVYEFLGDFWHGNPEIYCHSDKNPVSKKTYGYLYVKTMNKINKLEELGYKVVYIWEKDFKGK